MTGSCVCVSNVSLLWFVLQIEFVTGTKKGTNPSSTAASTTSSGSSGSTATGEPAAAGAHATQKHQKLWKGAELLNSRRTQILLLSRNRALLLGPESRSLRETDRSSTLVSDWTNTDEQGKECFRFCCK